MDRTKGISLIEWPSRLVDELIPEERLEININIDEDTDERIMSMRPSGETWEERLTHLQQEGYLDDLILDDEL